MLTRRNVLTGSAGDDVLVGGEGCDRLVGSAGNDILIAGSFEDACEMPEAGSSAYDLLRLLSSAWSAASPSEDPTWLEEDLVDTSLDMLTGSSGRDWFFINGGDVITDRAVLGKQGDCVTYV